MKLKGFEGSDKEARKNTAETLLKEANQLEPDEIMNKLDNLDAVEKQKFIARVTSLCLEAGVEKNPKIKKKCEQLMKAFSNLKTANDDDEVVIGQYPYNEQGLHLVLKGLVEKPGHSLSEVFWLSDVMKEFAYDQIDSDQSLSYLIKVSDNPGSMPRNVDLNLKLFKLLMKNGETKKVLYIIDRLLTAPVRGKGLGRELLKIVDKIVKVNHCEVAYGLLVPEKEGDLQRLIASHEKAGYEVIEDSSGASIAVKKYS